MDTSIPRLEELRTPELSVIERVGKNEYLTTSEVTDVYGIGEASVHYWLGRRLLDAISAVKGSRLIHLVRPDDIVRVLLTRNSLDRKDVHHAEPCSLPIANILSDPELQMRARMSTAAIASYAELQAEGDMAPLLVFRDTRDERFAYLADGFHRLEAARRIGKASVMAFAFPGGRDAALRAAISANSRTGVSRTNADKRRAVAAALKYYGSAMSHRQIASLTGVSSTFVDNVVKRMRSANRPATAPRPHAEPSEFQQIAAQLADLRECLQPAQSQFATTLTAAITLIERRASKTLNPTAA